MENKTVEKRIYSVLEVANILNISKTMAYSLVHEKHFKSVKIGSAIRISKQSFDKWLDESNL